MRLRRTVRDLVALSALPADWTGLGPDRIAGSLADVLLATVSLDLIYVQLAALDGDGVVECVRRKDRTDALPVEVARAAFAPLSTTDQTESSVMLSDPFGDGPLYVTVTPVGGNGGEGVLVSGSRHPDFPTEWDRALLGVAANQAAIVLERRRAEQEVRASAARKSAILETALDCVITMDHLGKVVDFNPAAERTFGYSRADVIGRELADLIIPPSLRERHHRGIAHYLATGEGPVLGKRLEVPAVRADGSEFPVELAITRIVTDGPPLFTAYLRDLTDQKRSEQHRNIRLAVTQALSDASAVDEGAIGVLQAVCSNLGWDVGFFWKIDGAQTALVCRKSWHRPDLPVSEFEVASFGRVFEKGEGLPGHVWSTGKPRWLLDVVRDADFPRAASAAKYGLHSAFAYPVVIGDRVSGVIEFFTRRIREPEADLLEMMGTVAGSLGQFIERKTAEEQLRDSEERFRSIFGQTVAGIAQTDMTGRFVLVNQRYCEMVGRPAEELTGLRMQDITHPDDLPGNLPLFQAMVNGGPPFVIEKRYVLPDESHVWVSNSVSLIRGGDGRPMYVVAVAMDITDRKRAEAERTSAEAALRESEEKLRLLADTIPQLAWMARPDGHIFWYNRRWYEYTGTTPEQMEGWGWQSVHDPETLPKVLDRWQGSIASGEPFDMVFPLKGADRQFRPFLTRVNPLRDERGRILYWFGTNTDISEQKQAEENSRFLADASAELAAVVDYESTLQKVANLAVPRFADWSAVDLADDDGSLRRLAVAHQDADKVALVRQLMREYPPDPQAPTGGYAVLRSGKPQMISEIPDEMLAQAAQDERHLALIRSLGLKSYICVPLVVSGRTLGLLTFATAESGRHYTETDLALAMDLAHRAAVAIENTTLYQALREADRRKDEFLATLAHELRNPLAPVRSALEILKMPRVDAQTAERSREIMERQVQHLVRLVDDLLDMSRVMRGKVELRRERVELATIVASAIETVQPLVDAQGHRLHVRISAESLVLDGDPIRLAQVVGNLLTNAAKYTEPNGQIWLTGERAGDMVVLRVRDNGIGIGKEMLPRIFELFEQADHGSTKTQGGLGIGLTLVTNLVEMHNGTVEARSAGLGHGSEFVVQLPLAEQTAEQDHGSATAAQADHVAPPSGKRLLIVDDNRDAANSLAMLLQLQRHEVRVTYSGMAALEMIKTYTPDVVLLDIGMPGMDGYEVARRIRQTPGLGTVVLAALTGWGQQEDRRRTAEAGFDHHLVKPPRPEVLEKLLA